MIPLVARLVLTYLIHSTLLLAAAALACRLLRERRLVLQEALLRAALLGGLATAALQVGLELRPVAGVLRLPLVGSAVPAGTPARPLADPAALAPATPMPVDTAPGSVDSDTSPAPVDTDTAAVPAWQARVVLAPTVFERLWSRAVESWRR
ncbi:MAG TPA: hypothetical protein VEQ10_20320, partial [Vicinamibacteria bacterium]|nr:hypothetical protein [Vicinamibacteria bacterium]